MQLIVKNIIPILLLRLQRFEKTNEMLSNCNSLSQTRLERALRDFRGHTQHINGLKKELEQVFKRIRVIKSRVAQQYPEAFKGNLLFLSFSLWLEINFDVFNIVQMFEYLNLNFEFYISFRGTNRTNKRRR